MPISKIPVGAIQSGTIATTQIADNAVTTAKILDDNVTSAKIVKATKINQIAAIDCKYSGVFFKKFNNKFLILLVNIYYFTNT